MVLNELELAEFRSRLVLDKHALDEQVAEQADVFYRVAKAHSEATDEADTAKADMDIVDSSKALEIRTAAEKTNEKITEGRIAERVLTSQEHAAALHRHQTARAQAKELGDLRDAYQQRASMLKIMTDLYVSGYFTLASTRGTEQRTTAVAADKNRAAMAIRRRSIKQP